VLKQLDFDGANDGNIYCVNFIPLER